MANNDEIRIGLSVVSDSAGTSKAQKDLADIRKRIDELKGNFKSGAKDVDVFTKELKDLEAQARKLDKALDEVGETRRIDIDSGELVDQTKKIGGQQLQSIGRNIRHLPSVQVPGLGVGTDTFGRAAEVMGKLGVSVQQLAVAAPIAIAAFAAIGIAVKNFLDNAKEQAEELNSVVEANRKTGQDIARGLTSEEATARQAELTRLREEEQRVLDQNKAAYASAIESQNALGETILRLTPQEQALADQIKKSEENIAGYETEQNALNTALEDGRIATNDAIEAEKALAQERTQGVLQEAAQAGELASLKERAKTLTQEQIDSELRALELRRIGAEQELKELEASGDTSEEVAQKIAQLRESLSFLGEQSDTLRAARSSARSSEADKAAEKARKDAERERAKAEKEIARESQKTAKAQESYADKIRDAKNAFSEAIEDINRGLQDDLIDNTQKMQDDLNEASIDFNQDQLKAEREYRRDLAQISRDAQRAERDAVRNRDFAAAADARENAQDAIDDRKQAETTDNQERLIAFDQQRAELARRRDLANRDDLIAADRARRDAAIRRDRALQEQGAMESNFQRNSLQGWNTYLGALMKMQSRFFDTARKGSTNDKDSGVSFNQLQYMTG